MLKKFQKNYKMFVLNKLYKKMCVFNKSVYLSRSYSEGREVRRLFTSYNILEKVYMIPKLLPKPWDDHQWPIIGVHSYPGCRGYYPYRRN